jgi:hypothetical protein
MLGVGSTVFLLPSSFVESMCGACAGKGGIGRRVGGRRPTQAAEWRRRKKRCRSRRRPKLDPLTRVAGDLLLSGGRTLEVVVAKLLGAEEPLPDRPP